MVQSDVELMYKISAGILSRQWEDDYIVFHTGSSDTYQLDVFSYSILKQLSHKALGLNALCIVLHDQFIFEGSKTLEQTIEAKLRDFIRLDLIDVV